MGNCTRNKAMVVQPQIHIIPANNHKRKMTVNSRGKGNGINMANTAESLDRAKTSSERNLILNVLSSHFLFSSLNSESLQTVVDLMNPFSFSPSTVICKQGDPATHFFIVKEGKLEVQLFNKTRSYIEKASTFGEIALMHESTNKYTIKSINKVSLWGIDRVSFRNVVQSFSEKHYQETLSFIENVQLFSILNPNQKERLMDALVLQVFPPNTDIVIEEEPGETLYIIKEGEVRCTVNGALVRNMQKGEFFGEQALLHNSSRTATVTAINTVKTLSIGKQDLVHVLGAQLNQAIHHNSIKIALERSFLQLTSEQIEKVVQYMQFMSISKGNKIISKGSVLGQDMWVILKGKVNKKSTLECIGDSEISKGNYNETEEDYVADEITDLAFISKDLLETVLGDLTVVSLQNTAFKALKQVELLRTLPNSTIEKLVSLLKLQEFADGEVVFFEGEYGNAFYIVKSGQVDIVKDNVVLRTIGQNNYFGERSILMNENRTASVISKGPSTLWAITKDDFLELIEEETRGQLLKRIALQNDKITLEELRYVKFLGKGMFGNVYLALHPSTGTCYALKTVHRQKIAAYDIYENLALEREVLLQLDHPFVMKLVKTMKDSSRLYFLTELVMGKDLFDVLRILNILQDEQAQFYAACIVLIVEHLHERKIIYRDFKPENIMVDEDGYLKLIDFGTAKIIHNRTYTIVGTPHYMAPEVILGKGYNLSADFWSLGIIIYEFLCGKCPFGEEENDAFNIYEKVLRHELEYPSYVSVGKASMNIIEQLLSQYPAMRGDYKEIMRNPFFNGLNWDKLLGRSLKPPHIPSLKSLDQDVENALKKDELLFSHFNREEARDDLPRHSRRPEPEGWDAEF